jgi:Zn-dependent protease
LAPVYPGGIVQVDLFRNIDIGTVAIQFAVLLFSLSIHEASHAWMADRLGDYTARYLGRVTLNPIPHIDPIGTVLFPLLMMIFPNFLLFGWAKPVPINSIHLRNPHRDQIFISLAGPASNLVAACSALVLLVVLKLTSAEARAFIDMGMVVEGSIFVPVLLLVYYMMTTNLVLAVFNLIPIPPLDGHWILYGILPRNAGAALERIGSYGFIILYALMFFGVFNMVLRPIVGFVRALLRVF